jgi:hypothetical protein
MTDARALIENASSALGPKKAEFPFLAQKRNEMKLSTRPASARPVVPARQAKGSSTWERVTATIRTRRGACANLASSSSPLESARHCRSRKRVLNAKPRTATTTTDTTAASGRSMRAVPRTGIDPPRELQFETFPSMTLTDRVPPTPRPRRAPPLRARLRAIVAPHPPSTTRASFVSVSRAPPAPWVRARAWCAWAASSWRSRTR